MRKSLLRGIRFCSMCGTRILMRGYGEQHHLTDVMKNKCLCYECAYWSDIANYPLECMEVLKDSCIQIFPYVANADKTMILGGKGKTRYFMRINDGSVMQSNDIWTIGKIPARLLSMLPPTIIEIGASAFRQLTYTPKKCYARACMDRYNCYRYSEEIESDSPYNKIPPKWNVGDEHCRYFINKTNIDI